MFEETKCDAIMIGRAAMGNPWIFREVNYYLEHGRELPQASREEKSTMMLEHARLLIDCEGERRGMLLMRKHFAWYTRGWLGGGELRRRGVQLTTFGELEALLKESISRPAA
jgi:tRNA-dihydrouridine synthase